MNAETLTALKGSIAKWEAIVAGTGTNGGTSDCPLCKLYNVNRSFVDQCGGCPVMDRTGMKRCIGSPYLRYEEAEDDGEDEEKLEELAKAELDFLRSLLPCGGREMTKHALVAIVWVSGSAAIAIACYVTGSGLPLFALLILGIVTQGSAQ